MSLIHSSAMFAFLRPLGPPRASTLRLLSTVAATSASTPKIPKHKIFAKPVLLDPATLATPLYHIGRTPSKELPIYHLAKAGGNKKLTRVKGVKGDIQALRGELQGGLGLQEEEVVINWLTKQVIIKGHKKAEVYKFLEARKF